MLSICFAGAILEAVHTLSSKRGPSKPLPWETHAANQDQATIA